MFQTVRAEKVDEKIGSFVLKVPKNILSCNFVLTSAQNLCLSKQFTYVHLKVLITLFQNIVYRVLVTVHEILRNKISKKMLTQ